jgi:hypothetical protein
MLKRLNSNIVIGFCTGCAIIAFAAFQSHIAISSTTFDIAAAVICLAPAAFAPVYRRACRNRTVKAQ